jgi:CRISPR/Cas system-associated exonuclease Cas4 (RecB family)
MPKVHLPLVSHRPWSPSKAELAGKCPLAFKYRYVDKVKTDVRSPPAEIGKAVHRVQELVLKGEDVKEAYSTMLKEHEEKLTEDEIEKTRTFTAAVLSFQDKLQRFIERYPAKGVLLEKYWAINPDFQPCDPQDPDAMIRGVVDLGLVLENGMVIIIDHKTGRMKSLDSFGVQLDTYAIMASSHMEDVKGVQCALHFMAHDKIVWGQPKTRKYIVDVLRPWLTKYLNDKAERVKAFSPREGRHCSWCDYRSICPEKVKKDVEGGENSGDGRSGEEGTVA